MPIKSGAELYGMIHPKGPQHSDPDCVRHVSIIDPNKKLRLQIQTYPQHRPKLYEDFAGDRFPPAHDHHQVATGR